MTLPKIINIQRYSIHDGDGIRTTIFFKGCPLNCHWCHNPESQNYGQELFYNVERCSSCLACASVCPVGAIKKLDKGVITDKEKCCTCGKCIDYCINNCRELVGKEYEIKELLKLVDKDSMFYEESGGGVTLSGGEVMSQNIEYLEELVKALKKKGYNVAIDTCGHAPYESYERILPYVDTFLYDIKMMDKEKHKKFMGKSNELILDNLKRISRAGAHINLRIPVIGGVNEDDASIDDIISFLKKEVRVEKVNLLPYHNTGSSKYEKLNLIYKGEDFWTPDNDWMEHLKSKFEENGFNNVKIGG